MNPDYRLKFICEMVNEIRDVAGTICSKKSFQSLAIKLVGQYPNTFEDRIGDERISCR